MKFVYDKKIDKQCHEVINTCSNIFGEEKKNGVFPVTVEVINKFELIWTSEVNNIFLKKMFDIFGSNIPKEFVCYLNSTPYSMDLKEGISISASTKTPIRTICHETNHYFFRKSLYKEEFFPSEDVENAKEIFTIINNIYFQDIMESPDMGWKKFWKDRFIFLKKWIKEH